MNAKHLRRYALVNDTFNKNEYITPTQEQWLYDCLSECRGPGPRTSLTNFKQKRANPCAGSPLQAEVIFLEKRRNWGPREAGGWVKERLEPVVGLVRGYFAATRMWGRKKLTR